VRRVEALAVPSTDDRGNYTKAGTLDAFSGRLDSGRGGLALSGRLNLIALPVAVTIGRAYPLAQAKGQDLSSTSILALRPEESKGQNDTPQLPKRMPPIWKDPQGPTSVSVLPVLQNLL